MTRIQVQRAAFLTASLGTLIGVGGFFVAMLYMFEQLGAKISMPHYLTMASIGGGFTALLSGTFLYFAHKPRTWGKLLCLLGLPLILFSRFLLVARFSYNPALFTPAVGGAMLLTAGLVLLIQDKGRWLNAPTK